MFTLETVKGLSRKIVNDIKEIDMNEIKSTAAKYINETSSTIKNVDYKKTGDKALEIGAMTAGVATAVVVPVAVTGVVVSVSAAIATTIGLPSALGALIGLGYVCMK